MKLYKLSVTERFVLTEMARKDGVFRFQNRPNDEVPWYIIKPKLEKYLNENKRKFRKTMKNYA